MTSRQPEDSTPPSARWAWRVLIGVLIPLTVAGCSDLTAGGLAEVETVLSGDAPEEGSAASHRTSSTSFAAAHPDAGPTVAASGFSGSQAQGEVSATLEVSIQSPQGQWILLTDGLEEATVDLSGQTEATLKTEQLEPGIYPRVRVRITDIQARVEAGLPVLGTIGVDFGDASSISVEREIELDLADGDEVQVLVDLNSTQWLNAAAPALKVVAAAHLRNALEIRVR